MIETAIVEEKQPSDYFLFVEKAQTAAAIVSEIANFEEAVDYTIDLCGKKERTRYVIGDDKEGGTSQAKTIAAPALSDNEYKLLSQKCTRAGFECLSGSMRKQLSGVDIGFSYGDIGIAETGTIVMNCPDEELRLATMICEYHVCILHKSKIVSDGFASENLLQEFMLDAPNYTAFITGPSRTADIERVLTIGVHGPLELHILVLEDE